jgi:hypothetical protein
MEERKRGWIFKVPSGIIDTFSCTVLQPREESWEFLRKANEYNIKYEVVMSIGVPRIIWLSGPWKGAAADSTISSLSGIKEILSEGEALLADKAYRGDKISFIVPFSGHRYVLSSEERAYNFLVYCARQSIERIIR